VHPYLVTPEHTAIAREAVGPDALVAPEQALVLETDPTAARELARQHLSGYLRLPNYANNWRRLGFTDDDIGGGGSDRLVDALVAWGDDEALAARVRAHREAGADHVCVQVIGPDPRALATDGWRRVAPALV
jgi:probable F420-dependent oxidoreductase